MSNLYKLSGGQLTTNPMRMFPSPPLIKLGDDRFGKVSARKGGESGRL